jgi:hypothetical protein
MVTLTILSIKLSKQYMVKMLLVEMELIRHNKI